MKTITGLFNTHAEASSAVAALEDAGVTDVSMISPHRDGDDTGTAEGAGIGAAVGGVGGLLAGLGAFAIPGIGPVVGAGWLATTLIGAAAGGAAGGLIGSLTDAGIDENDAHVYAEGVKRGGTLVTARVDETELDVASAILNKHRPIDTTSRRREYEGSGWNGFSDDDSDTALSSNDNDLATPPVVTPFPR